MELNSTNVSEVFGKCLYGEHFDENEKRDDAVFVEGIVHNFVFKKENLEENKENILDMLCCLPEEFQKQVGGGWSFLQACVDNKGNQWADHMVMEQLFSLGIGLGVCKYLLPKELWKVLPGSVPYIVFDNPRVVSKKKGE